ncbi:helix-turn-helix transcriptional regulator [Streptomyces tanashiensis]|uniref:helix-turn-helix transcriptional regulator n=1 Tax=Streptomyces tanashiensis TaxID=67367 RepID=UPI001E3CDE22|nr:helix-turn-helix transcriptional regulator [Streptomyces tanashiensis]
MDVTAELVRARDAFAHQAWSEAYTGFSDADDEQPLEPDDLVRLATVAHLVGRDTECAAATERAHQAYLSIGRTASAVRCAFWLAVPLLLRGETARGGGWLARARRLLDDGGIDCVEQGYLLFPEGMRLVHKDPATALATFGEAAATGERFGDPDLVALARHGQGRAVIAGGDPSAGMALLDETMVAVASGELSPLVTGMIYCSTIEACQEIFDLRRAQEWTAALSDWCAAQPDLVPYRGQCLVHRSQVLQTRGAWPDAMEEARRACERLSEPPNRPALGMALYQQAELHRVRGAFAGAEEGYRQAGECGHRTQPGLAQLWMAQGRVDEAVAAIRGAADERRDRLGRARVLSAYVEIVLAAGDVPGARAASEELSRIADDIGAPLLRAVSAHARGAVFLAEDDAAAALDVLLDACRTWDELEAPYDRARSVVLLALARRRLGDVGTARLELDGARQVFRRLGAAPDLARLDALTHERPRSGAGLSPRELEVLRLVATGRTNHAIAVELVLSEKTVARHLSNIFAKLDLSSRSAATAYAYEHDLVSRGR